MNRKRWVLILKLASRSIEQSNTTETEMGKSSRKLLNSKQPPKWINSTPEFDGTCHGCPLIEPLKTSDYPIYK